MTWLSYYYKKDYGFWFRIFGVGLHIKNTKMSRLTFSQRNGLAKGIKIFQYWVEPLWRNDTWRKFNG